MSKRVSPGILRAVVLRTASLLMMTAGLSLELQAHEGAEGVIMDRMRIMTLYDAARLNIAAMIEGRIPYDGAKIKDYAHSIAERSGESLTQLFPEGSLHDPSLASPLVWEDWSAFTDLALELQVRAVLLEKSAGSDSTVGDATADGNGASSLAEAYDKLVETCDTCHARFRN